MTRVSDAAAWAVNAGGVSLPFAAMNAAGSVTSMGELKALARSQTGAVVLRTATVHPFVHPEFRSLKNPGVDKLAPVAGELAGAGGPPVVASVAGGTLDEFTTLARVFADAGVAAIEAHLGESWVEATIAPCEDLATLRTLVGAMAAASAVPVWVRLPERCPLPHRAVVEALIDGGARAVVVRNEFTEFEKLLLAVRAPLDVIARGGIGSGWDVTRALTKGAQAVQVGPTLGADGVGVFGRLAREMHHAQSARR